MATTDVLVIGGGIVGLVAAMELAEGCASVTVVDAGQNAGTGANAGSLHVQMQSRFIRLFPELAPNVEAALPFYKLAADIWVKLEAKIGNCELTRLGGLMLAEGTEQMAFLEGKAEREARRGLDVELLDRAALDRIAPWLGAQIVGAELCRDEGKLNPLLANSHLVSRCAALGVNMVNDRIEHIERNGLRLSAQGKLERYEATEVIVAAAWGSGELLRSFGISIPTQAEPLHMNITEASAQEIGYLIQHAERSITLKQFRTGQIVIGGGWPAIDKGVDTVPAVKASSLLGNVALAAELVPAIANLRVIRTWAGMNTTADGGSIVGRLEAEPGVTVAIPGDAGYTLGPLIGQMAAAISLGQDAPADPELFKPNRFGSPNV